MSVLEQIETQLKALDLSDPLKKVVVVRVGTRNVAPDPEFMDRVTEMAHGFFKGYGVSCLVIPSFIDVSIMDLTGVAELLRAADPTTQPEP